MAKTEWLILLFHTFLLLGKASARATQQLATRASTVPAPVVIPPSQKYEGNDGPWSTFQFNIGTPAQTVDVLVSTASYQTWVVVPQGCPPSGPANCATLRGGLFNYNQSTSWVPNNVTVNSTYALGLEKNLGYSGDNGLYGYDTLTLGLPGDNVPTLEQQIVAGIATPDFYLGEFGLDPRPTNFSNFSHSVNSYMTSLAQKNLIPSESWGYTAGNQYRENGMFASLTLGGYDSSRFAANDLIFDFNANDDRAFIVQISSITYAAKSTNSSLLSTSVSAYIDSTIPWIYLPVDACKKFEDAFGIAYNEYSQAYLVNDTLHTKLLSENATVTFTLQNLTATDQVEIALPYAAFDLIAEYPLAENKTRYFPLARAENSTQYTLGRTFFQEAYVTADYGRRTFTVSQCTWNAGAPQSIHAISSTAAPSNATVSAPSTKSKGLSGGAIAGIVIGSIIGVAALAALGYFLYRSISSRPDRNDDLDKPEVDSNGKVLRPELVGGKHIGRELDSKEQRFTAEADGKRLPGYEIDGVQSPGHELAGDPRLDHELDSGQHSSLEMPAREEAAAELPWD